MPHGVDVTLAELQEMAMRQQQQIEAQQQMLVAKEQRLKFLKQQELRHQQVCDNIFFERPITTIALKNVSCCDFQFLFLCPLEGRHIPFLI